MKRTKNNLNKITVDYRSKRMQHPLTITNTRISKYMKEFQTPQKRWTTKEKTGKPKPMNSGTAYYDIYNDYDNEYDINLNKTGRQLTGYGVEKMMVETI
jgi:hypothetical protein